MKKYKNLACARDLAVVAFVILVEGAGGGIMTGIDCVVGYWPVYCDPGGA